MNQACVEAAFPERKHRREPRSFRFFLLGTAAITQAEWIMWTLV